jgi:hypothetical protein
MTRIPAITLNLVPLDFFKRDKLKVRQSPQPGVDNQFPGVFIHAVARVLT